MTKYKNILLTALVAIIATLLTLHFAGGKGASSASSTTQTESTYDRVMRTGVIRCGYVLWYPYMTKDINTGEFSGVSYNFITTIAKELDLKIEWTEEVGWGSFQEGLKTNRYDLMCTPVWQSGQRAKIGLMTVPAYYNGMYAVGRATEKRFQNNMAEANQPGVKIVVVDGDVTSQIFSLKFPKATAVRLPQMVDSGQYYLNLSSGKADIAFSDIYGLRQFNKDRKPEEQLKPLFNQPVQFFGNTFIMRPGDTNFKNMLDAVIQSINTSGQSKQLLSEYSDTFFPASQAYEIPHD